MTDVPEFLAVPTGRVGRLNGGGRKPAYQPFRRILNGDLHECAYRYADDLRIRFRTHVLPDTHQLFRILTPRQLIALELIGPPPLESVSCCGKWFSHIPVGDRVEDLRYEPDHLRIQRHRRACLSHLVRRPPVPRNRKVTSNRAPTRHVGDADDWGPTTEHIPLLGANNCTPARAALLTGAPVCLHPVTNEEG